MGPERRDHRHHGREARKAGVVRANSRNGAVFTGDSRFVLETASHVVIEGLDFRCTDGPAIELRGCNGVRVTRNTFHLVDTKRASWVVDSS